jgi:hypothetical protein
MDFHLYGCAGFRHASPAGYSENDASEMALLAFRSWKEHVRPYYKCWPSIISALTRLSLDFRLRDSGLKPRTLLLRFPVGAEPEVDNIRLLSVLTCCAEWANGLAVTMEPFFREADKFASGFSWHSESSTGTIEDDLETWRSRNYPHYSESRESISIIATKVAITCHLLAEDPTILVPDVLSRHRGLYAETKDRKYIEKAKRRGVVGWRLGEAYENCPHIRRPHLGLRWTGKGKAIPRIVAIKGSVVHRKKLTDVPTGYLTPDGVEVEP